MPLQPMCALGRGSAWKETESGETGRERIAACWTSDGGVLRGCSAREILSPAAVNKRSSPGGWVALWHQICDSKMRQILLLVQCWGPLKWEAGEHKLLFVWGSVPDAASIKHQQLQRYKI